MNVMSPRSSLPMQLAVGLFLCSSAAAQQVTDTFLQQQRTVEERIRRQLDQELTADQRAVFDWGGSYSLYGMIYDDGVNSSRTLRRNDGRLWTRVSLDKGAHEGYARVRMSYLDFNAGDSFDGDDNDWEGPNLERGFYQFSLRNAMSAYGKQRVPYDARVKIGRQYVEFGTGYALSLPLDAVLLTGEAFGFEITGLIGNTIRSMDDIDQSRPGGDETDRDFYGVQLRYIGLNDHKPFLYAVWNEDRNGERPRHPLQEWDYESHYVGFGSTGTLIISDLRYSTEWVFEGGQSTGDRRFLHHDGIDAWAWDILLEYYMPAPMKPRFLAEYMFASGDPDRIGSPTDAIGGNRNDFEDTSFVGFGFRDTGLSFAPRLSNIHIWRLGASFFPFEKIEVVKDIELGTDWFLYSKHHDKAAVSDYLADRGNGFLGWEMDYYINWRLFSDLSWTARYGVFFPADAFSDETCRYFFLTGFTWSF